MPRAYRDGGMDLNRTVKRDRKPFITIKHPAWVDIAQVIYPEALSDLSRRRCCPILLIRGGIICEHQGSRRRCSTTIRQRSGSIKDRRQTLEVGDIPAE